jgi:hypothetical protein
MRKARMQQLERSILLRAPIRHLTIEHTGMPPPVNRKCAGNQACGALAVIVSPLRRRRGLEDTAHFIRSRIVRRRFLWNDSCKESRTADCGAARSLGNGNWRAVRRLDPCQKSKRHSGSNCLRVSKNWDGQADSVQATQEKVHTK